MKKPFKNDPEFAKFWSEQSRKGDPDRNPNLLTDAFAAGRAAGRDEAHL